MLNRAEYGCLIANSLRGEQTLSVEIASADDATASQDSHAECDDQRTGLRANRRQ